MKIKCMLLIFFLFTAGMLPAQVKYTPEDFSDPSKMAKKIAKVNAKNITKHEVRKVMITEFFGEFVTSKETSPGAFERMHSDWITVRKQSTEIGSDYYESLTNEIYEAVADIFRENNIEVLDKNVLLENEDYIGLGLKEERTGRQYTGGAFKQSTTSEVIKRSVSGMGMYSETLRVGAVMKINQMVPNIANTTGCDAALTVKFRVGLGKKNQPTLDYLRVTMSSNLAEYKAGKGKVSYAFKNGGVILFDTNKGLINPADIAGDGKGTIDIKKYNNAIMDMVKAMCNAYSYQLQEVIL